MQPTANILIVEDSETQALQLAWLLEKNGWEVIRAPEFAPMQMFTARQSTWTT